MLVVATSAGGLTTGDSNDNEHVLFCRVHCGGIVGYGEQFDPARAEPAFNAIGAWPNERASHSKSFLVRGCAAGRPTRHPLA